MTHYETSIAVVLMMINYVTSTYDDKLCNYNCFHYANTCCFISYLSCKVCGFTEISEFLTCNILATQQLNKF
jgi:hypothetical protein